jgi:hypothetical protein
MERLYTKEEIKEWLDMTDYDFHDYPAREAVDSDENGIEAYFKNKTKVITEIKTAPTEGQFAVVWYTEFGVWAQDHKWIDGRLHLGKEDGGYYIPDGHACYGWEHLDSNARFFVLQ